MRVPRLSALVCSIATLLAAAPARALVWPDVVEEVVAGLHAPSPATRRAATERIASLGPLRAAPLLEIALGDPDPEVRVAAAQSAIRLHATDVTKDVVKWLKGERDVRLRVAACEVARALPAPSVTIEPLGRALGDTESPLVRAAAAEALGAQGTVEGVPALLGHLDDSSPAVRVQVVRALAKLHDARAVVPLVGKAQDSSVEVRQAVARALGDLADTRAVQTLLALARDNAPEVKLEALTALGRARAESAVSTLGPLASDRSPTVRTAAIAALGRIGSAEAVRVLVTLLGQTDDASGASLERTPVRDALVAAGDTAIPELARALDTGAAGRAAGAAWVLGEVHAKSQTQRIVAALRRGSLSPAAALNALAGCGDTETVPVVLEYLADPSPAVRAAATRAAFALLDPKAPDGRAVEPLFAALRARGLEVADRAALARLLGRTGASRAAAVLIAMLGAREPALRLAAIDALGQLGTATNGAADEALLALLRDSEASIRLRASIALSKAGGDKARETLLSWIDGGDAVDRAAVLTALGGVLAHASNEAALDRVLRSLRISAGGDRDALLLIVGRSTAGTHALAELAASGDEDDRRTIATVVGAAAVAAREELIKKLLADPDASVRAQAAWAAFAFPARVVGGALMQLATSSDADVAANAVASLGRIPLASGDAHPARSELAKSLCDALGSTNPAVRANALAGLAQTHTQCENGKRERLVLAKDPSPDVRALAARTVWQEVRGGSGTESRTALAECASNDRHPRVSFACRERPAVPNSTVTAPSAVEVFVIPYGSTAPKARAPYMLETATGFLRSGSADRRGALFDPAAPDGDLTLRRP